MRHLSLAFVFLAAVVFVRAQSIHWEPASGTLSYNQASELQLVFENCEPKDDPAVPAVAGLQLQSVGQSRNMSIVNGRMSQSVVITYRARATQQAPVTIPTFGVQTNKGRIEVAAATYDVGEATVGQSNVSLDAVANSKIDVPNEVWAGQVFKLGYTLNIARRYFHSLGNQPEWNPAPLTVEEWAKPEMQETVVSGEHRAEIYYRTRALLKQPGDVTLNAVAQLVNLTTGAPSMGFFARPNLEQYSITSSRPTIHVKPLPSSAPATFNGAVGQFALESKVVPHTAHTGEPITWTLTMSGIGNWPDISALPARDVSRDFRVVQPQAHRTLKDGAVFEGTLTEDVVLIPTQPGTYTLGPISWTYFDPNKGEYQTVSTEKVTVTVSAAPVQTPAATPAPNNTRATSAAAPAEQQQQLAAPPSAPAGIPRDALPDSPSARAPWGDRTLLALGSLPWLGVLVLWLGLAWRRARATDPLKPRREARARLKATIAEIGRTKDQPRLSSLLQAWQRDSAIVWGIPSAVPTPRDLKRDPAVTPELANQWAALWSEAENAQYRSGGTLPDTWASRAEAALAAKPTPGFSPFQLFLRRNLLPFAAMLALTLVFVAQVHAADAETSAAKAYAAGDFTGAESIWRKEVAADPLRWSSRHNLALSLAQQNRWGEAAAQAAAAFVQHPRNPTVRWELTLLLSHAGYTPNLLTGFVSDAPAQSVARLLSPAEWQCCFLALMLVGGAGAALLLLRAYRSVGRWGRIVGLTFVALGILGSATALLAKNLYQEAQDTRAVLVWKPSILRSIPTEADTTQKTTPLAAGTVAIVDKTFLGWSRLAFTNGQTGWVRQEDVVSFWK
ncbi:MAG TPA: BatD family protein [Opitutaceae bacterium]|nr:BatD family protein [Opitutaceae bacterium]